MIVLSDSRDSMRMKKQDCTTTGLGIMIHKLERMFQKILLV